LNSADSLVYQTEKFVKENDDKLSTDDKASLDEKIQNLKTAFTEKRVADLDNLSTELNNVLHPITSKMYESQSQPEQDNTSTSSGNTEDVEYEEVK
jgi:molecular chaperone DnaK